MSTSPPPFVGQFQAIPKLWPIPRQSFPPSESGKEDEEGHIPLFHSITSPMSDAPKLVVQIKREPEDEEEEEVQITAGGRKRAASDAELPAAKLARGTEFALAAAAGSVQSLHDREQFMAHHRQHLEAMAAEAARLKAAAKEMKHGLKQALQQGRELVHQAREETRSMKNMLRLLGTPEIGSDQDKPCGSDRSTMGGYNQGQSSGSMDQYQAKLAQIPGQMKIVQVKMARNPGQTESDQNQMVSTPCQKETDQAKLATQTSGQMATRASIWGSIYDAQLARIPAQKWFDQAKLATRKSIWGSTYSSTLRPAIPIPGPAIFGANIFTPITASENSVISVPAKLEKGNT